MELSHVYTPWGPVSYPGQDTDLGASLLQWAYVAHIERSQMSDEALDFLLSAGAPGLKFPTIGTVHRGKIVSYEKTQQTDIDGELKFFKSGDPMFQIVFTLDTDDRDPDIEDDNGVRRLFAKGQMLGAIKGAIAAAKWKSSLVGGTLAIKFEAEGEASQRGYSKPKVYKVKFTPPDPMDVKTEDEFGDDDAPAAKPAPTSSNPNDAEEWDEEPF
jgi:hypothetical protein